MESGDERVNRRCVVRVGLSAQVGVAAVGLGSRAGAAPAGRRAPTPAAVTSNSGTAIDVRTFGAVDTADPAFDAFPVLTRAVADAPSVATIWLLPVPVGQA